MITVMYDNEIYLHKHDFLNDKSWRLIFELIIYLKAPTVIKKFALWKPATDKKNSIK